MESEVNDCAWLRQGSKKPASIKNRKWKTACARITNSAPDNQGRLFEETVLVNTTSIRKFSSLDTVLLWRR
jgi:hypothetical protein